MRRPHLLALLCFVVSTGCDPDEPEATVDAGRPDACTEHTWYADCDNDGIAALGGETLTGCDITAPPACGGAWITAMPIAGAADCNDTRKDVYPDAPEICDSVDNDCDGSADEDGLTTFYQDSDGDGHGNSSSSMTTCNAPAGYVTSSDDCNDARADVYPGHAELCDGADNNCNQTVDEGATTTYYRDLDSDGHGSASSPMQACAPPTGYVTSSDDCNDLRADVYPGHAELCDGADNNCNQTIDEGVKTTYYRDSDGDGYGAAAVTTQACSSPTGYVTNNTDCNDARADVRPGGTEVCDGADNNCSGVIDEGVKTTFYRDADGDSYGAAAVTTQACSSPTGYVTNNTDCNDSSALMYPGRAEVCDGLDNDCDTTVDDGVKATYYLDADGDGYGNPSVTTQACSRPTGYASNSTDCNDIVSTVHPGAAERCFNDVDDDCDTEEDEAVECSIACDWSGNARWLSHGYDQAGMAQVGVWASCIGGKLSYMDSVITTPPGEAIFTTGYTAQGLNDNVVGCDWASSTRWASQGYDDANAWTYGATISCNSSGRVTAFNWDLNVLTQTQIPNPAIPGQLGCDWDGPLFLTHGWNNQCAFETGFVVTCRNDHITNFEWVENTAQCAKHQ
ncbi:MAG TPA: putative metal-binding motif-containing protein [Kofleriaceae bacterium]